MCLSHQWNNVQIDQCAVVMCELKLFANHRYLVQQFIRHVICLLVDVN